MTTASGNTSHVSKLNPARAAGAIALVALILGGGYLAYSNRVPRPESAADFRPDPPMGRGGFYGGGGNRIVMPRVREAVSVQPRVVTIRDGEMTISGSLRSDSNWNLYVSFNGESLGGAQAQRLMLQVRRTLDAKQPPANLKLTPVQRSALAAVPLAPPELSADQLKQLTDLLNKTQKLTANAPEMTPIKASLQALAAQIKAADQNAIKARYAERDAKFRSILSPEQVETLLGNRNANRNPPA